MLGDAGVSFTEIVNADWTWPPAHPELHCPGRPAALRQYALRQYRAWRGHQTMSQRGEGPVCLMLEDDASPALPEWRDAVCRWAAWLLDSEYEAVSLHGRDVSWGIGGGQAWGIPDLIDVPSGHRAFLEPVLRMRSVSRLRWHLGCLAYLVTQAGRARWARAVADGMPCDLFLVNDLKTAVVRQPVFLHDQSAGSLIANTGPCRTDATCL